MQKNSIDIEHVLDELKHFLPSQTSLKDFIHHNSLHAFQHLKFYDAIFTASDSFGYHVTLELQDYRALYKIGRIREDVLCKIIIAHKGEENIDNWKSILLEKSFDESKESRIGNLRSYWKKLHNIDLDSAVQPLLFRLLATYLDQGISLWKFPDSGSGFLTSIRYLESTSISSLFNGKRARQLLHDTSTSIASLLNILVGKEEYFEQYLFDQQFTHRGWSGMITTIEQRPDTLYDTKRISLHDVVFIELLLEIDALDRMKRKRWKPLLQNVNEPPCKIVSKAMKSELNDVRMMWQDAFEWSYYDEVLAGIKQAQEKPTHYSNQQPVSFQALFCIDERECSLRRHIEFVDRNCETLGTPGFFGVEFYFQPENAKFYDKLCPAPVTPKHLIKEIGTESRQHALLYSQKTHTLLAGGLSSLSLGFASAVQLFRHLFFPKMSPAISDAFAHMDKKAVLTIENINVQNTENGLQIGFTIEEIANRVEGLLRSVGLIENFASIVYLIAHGSSSANNPHHGAHDCGACSGRPGSVNARVMAFMANHKRVRDVLRTKGISLPTSTQFIGALHDTAADQIEYYDEEVLTSTNIHLHKKNITAFEKALDLNAKERSRRFASINTLQSISKIRKAINERSVSLFEPRPELGHGTNTLCIIGSRNITKQVFLDRRAFLNSYDYKTDPDGALLTGVMRPIGPVCGGINLEYYFSRIDNHKLGAGTKLPHHVVALLGVTNSFDGDLRPGLPLQMIEVHDPVRLLVLVEHFPEIVLKTIQTSPEMYEWYINEWVHLVAIHPETHTFYTFSKGEFTEYIPLQHSIPTTSDILSIINNAKEMDSNYIVDATKENLPVYNLK